GDVLLVDALLQEPPAAVLARAEPSLLLGELALELAELPVLELGHLVEIVLALGLLDLLLRLLDLLAQLAEPADRALLALPLRAQRVRLLAEVGSSFSSLPRGSRESGSTSVLRDSRPLPRCMNSRSTPSRSSGLEW